MFFENPLITLTIGETDKIRVCVEARTMQCGLGENSLATDFIECETRKMIDLVAACLVNVGCEH